MIATSTVRSEANGPGEGFQKRRLPGSVLTDQKRDWRRQGQREAIRDDGNIEWMHTRDHAILVNTDVRQVWASRPFPVSRLRSTRQLGSTRFDVCSSDGVLLQADQAGAAAWTGDAVTARGHGCARPSAVPFESTKAGTRVTDRNGLCRL
jgi:hypothetical protein